MDSRARAATYAMLRRSMSSFLNLKVEKRGALVDVMLNRPKKLNALNLDMVRELQTAFDIAEASQGCVALALRGDKRAFCAGGDIVAVRAAGLEYAQKPHAAPLFDTFFREEYALNARTGALARNSRVVQCSFWDGLVLGGGVGLSVHGRYRIATESTQLAMPEVAIGLFPDVGASLALASTPGRAGEYAALTGARLDATDVVALGLATHCVASSDLDAIRDALSMLDGDLPPDAFADAVGATLQRFNVSHGASAVQAHAADIDACFSAPDVPSILAALDAHAAPFCAAAAVAIRRGSPTAAAITLEAVRRARGQALNYVLRTDFRVMTHMVRPDATSADFYEGVRAALVDKDRAPAWRPAPDDVAGFFEAPDGGFEELSV